MDKNEAPNFQHGMFEDTGNFSHKEKLRVFESAEDYVDQLGGADNLYQSQIYDCYLLAVTEFRIARAEGIVFEEVEEYLNKQAPEQNLQILVNRRQNLRKDLGLLSESPEQKSAESDGFFDSLSSE